MHIQLRAVLCRQDLVLYKMHKDVVWVHVLMECEVTVLSRHSILFSLDQNITFLKL